MENQGLNEDHSQSDPHSEAGIFRSQITKNSGPEVARDNLQQHFLLGRRFNAFCSSEAAYTGLQTSLIILIATSSR